MQLKNPRSISFLLLFLHQNYTMSQAYILLVFGLAIGILFLIDIRLLLSKQKQNKSNKSAIIWTAIWVGSAMLFSLLIWQQKGFEKFSQFQSAYWIEQALSVDNLFVFLLVFGFFKVSGLKQQKVLLWGIIGAMIFRAIFIFSGIGIIKITYLPEFSIGSWHFSADPTHPGNIIEGSFQRINLVLTLFGAFLIYAGIKSFMVKEDDESNDFSNSFGARLAKKTFRVRMHFVGDRFFYFEKGKRFATLLFVVLCVVETTDVLFAVDSIPAIFSIAPDDPFILYTSNVFAIFGLRAMYFLLANSMHLFSKLKYGLALILMFIGAKMLLSPIFHLETYISLIVVLCLLIGSVIISLIYKDSE